MTLKGMRSCLYSPALPAVTLLFGMVFCLAFVGLSGLRWQPFATIMLYGVLFIWVALLVWRQRKLWGGFGVIDLLFFWFVLVVLASLLIKDVSGAEVWKYGRLLPFMVVVPYVCGRLMRTRDIYVFSRIIALAGLVMLMLLATDYWLNVSKLEMVKLERYSRWPFFGYDHALLLVGMLFAGSLAAHSFIFLAEMGDNYQRLSFRKVAALLALGLVAGALVMVAARGALFGGILGVFCSVLVLRHCSISRRLVFLLYVAAIMGLTYSVMPKQQAQVYANMVNLSANIWGGASRSSGQTSEPFGQASGPFGQASGPSTRASEPILGKASCQPIKQGIDSLAIRGLLYQEAFTMFTNWSLWGVGAALFGRYSCSGEMGFPHSTVLQSLAELGIFGGILFSGLMVSGFVVLAQRTIFAADSPDTQAAQLIFVLFIMYLILDQFYGNYFMAVGTYLMLGMAAGMQSNSTCKDGLVAVHVK